LIALIPLLLAVASPDPAVAPPIASVADVVSAASLCVDTVASPHVDPQVLIRAGWTKHGEQTPGGTAYEKSGVNVRVALVGQGCTLVAMVKSPVEVQEVLLQLDDAVSPDGIAETEQGIRLTKGKRIVDFLVGPPSEQTPAGVRIDIRHSESR
jgi:hypothetical protein